MSNYGMRLKSYKLRTDNNTGIPGIHENKPYKSGPKVKKRYKVKGLRTPSWTVQFKAEYICTAYSFNDAVMRRWQEEQKVGMNKDNPSKSKAYVYLKLEGLI